MQKAAKEKAFLLFFAIASALFICAPTIASSTHASTAENRIELFLLEGQNRTGQQAIDTANRVENYDSRWGVALESPVAPRTALRYKLGPNDVDWRGTGKTVTDALDDAFAKTGHARSDFNVTKWGKDKWGKSHPVEWRHKSGAEVNVDWPHAHNGPDAPHVGWQTGGKRGAGGAVRGHTILDDVPFNRPTIR